MTRGELERLARKEVETIKSREAYMLRLPSRGLSRKPISRVRASDFVRGALWAFDKIEESP